MRTRSRHYPSPPRSRARASGNSVLKEILHLRQEIIKACENCRILHDKVSATDHRMKRLGTSTTLRRSLCLRLQVYLGVAKFYAKFVQRKSMELGQLVQLGLEREEESEMSEEFWSTEHPYIYTRPFSGPTTSLEKMPLFLGWICASQNEQINNLFSHFSQTISVFNEEKNNRNAN